MFYKNVSYSDKTFYGVTFKPGEVAEVPGYVNDLYMIIAPKPSKKQTVASDAPAVTSKKDDKKDGKKEAPSKDQNSEPVSEEK